MRAPSRSAPATSRALLTRRPKRCWPSTSPWNTSRRLMSARVASSSTASSRGGRWRRRRWSCQSRPDLCTERGPLPSRGSRRRSAATSRPDEERGDSAVSAIGTTWRDHWRTTMERTRWLRIEELFELAQAQTAEARQRFLAEACGSDISLRNELEEMLAAASDHRPLAIEEMVANGPAGGWAVDPWLETCLGPWRLVDVLGRGGMGAVYLAERVDGHYQQKVAVKLVRSGSREPHAIERFRTERQVLAHLRHPNIAGLLDGGLAPDRTPYLVMEFVDGVPINECCSSRRLSVEARLRLFRWVCDAVQHAHRALIVHRDLKPSNILVSRSGDVKLLD